MLMSVSELLLIPSFSDIPEEVLKRKLDAIESLIRSYTNNNFQVREARFRAQGKADLLYGSSPYIRKDDTVQLNGINFGLYVVRELIDGQTRVDRELFDADCVMVTKVSYPPDIKDGVINLLTWETENRDKVGIKSESLSRHSVTYYDQDASNQIMGYPVSLLGFLKPYMKARF
jgi:hypothetical protein